MKLSSPMLSTSIHDAIGRPTAKQDLTRRATLSHTCLTQGMHVCHERMSEWVGGWVGGWVGEQGSEGGSKRSNTWNEINHKQVGNAAYLLLGSLLLGLDVGVILCQSLGHGNPVIMQLLRLLRLSTHQS